MKKIFSLLVCFSMSAVLASEVGTYIKEWRESFNALTTAREKNNECIANKSAQLQKCAKNKSYNKNQLKQLGVEIVGYKQENLAYITEFLKDTLSLSNKVERYYLDGHYSSVDFQKIKNLFVNIQQELIGSISSELNQYSKSATFSGLYGPASDVYGLCKSRVDMVINSINMFVH